MMYFIVAELVGIITTALLEQHKCTDSVQYVTIRITKGWRMYTARCYCGGKYHRR